MRLGSVALSLCLAASASASYFSEGWKPGQTTRKLNPTPAPGFNPPGNRKPPPNAPASTAAATGPAGSFWSQLFTTGPLGSLLEKQGVNVTAALEKARKSEDWDERIPLIYDETFENVIVNEKLTPEEEKERVWFLVVCASGGPQASAVSEYVDKQFDEAYNISQIEGDLPNVRFGRVNYMEVTYITTKWGLWKAPALVVLTDRGKTLRFFYPSTLNTKGAVMHKFLVQEAWKMEDPWSSSFAPGGDREYIMEHMAVGMAWGYHKLNTIPKFVLLIATGGLTSMLLSLMHRGDKTPKQAPKRAMPRPRYVIDENAPPRARPATETAPAPSPPATPSKAKKRKGKK
ncbi:hypothetical protein AURDEDRAFT_80183 [Auricularia subglabra TFB-10046 SS5]|nr:hypothetical protein AURDEDRAFT_80183 [Auricularia subglabra TFB-10046 SS5]